MPSGSDGQRAAKRHKPCEEEAVDVNALWEKMKSADDTEESDEEGNNSASPPSPPEDWHSQFSNVNTCQILDYLDNIEFFKLL